MKWNELSQASLDEIVAWANDQPWCRAMADCQQDVGWHAEGDVWTHTKMVCAQLPRLADWPALTPHEQTVLIFTALFHDSAKPLTSQIDPTTGRVTSEHAELKEIAKNCITRHHAHHYLGFAETQYSLFQKEDPPRVKPLLYVYRVLLTGIHLMRTGEVQANLGLLNGGFKLPYVPDLIERKVGGAEKGRLEKADLGFHQREYERLRAELERAYQVSKLPEAPSGASALHDLLVRIRLCKNASSE